MRRAVRLLSFVILTVILIREHALQLGLIGRVRNYSLGQLPFSRPWLRCQDVPGVCVTPGDLTCGSLLETFGRTFMCLQFGHTVRGNLP